MTTDGSQGPKEQAMQLVERASAGLHAHVLSKIQSLQIRKDSVMLDVGCGTGAFLARLANSGFSNLHGVDISAPAAGLPGIVFAEHDLDLGGMPYDDASIDLVTCIEVLEHVENTGIFLKELARIVKPDGVILLTTPNLHSLEARVRLFLLGKLKQFDELGDPTHIYPVFIHPFKRILQRHSLKIAKHWGYPLDGSSPTSRSVLSALTTMLRWMGLVAQPAGDHLCLQIHRDHAAQTTTSRPKYEVVTSHY
jgi:2-polyprenyl-3-methyl-5-hydroxy-6-metoxy-1,4-benzoquinol methylase